MSAENAFEIIGDGDRGIGQLAIQKASTAPSALANTDQSRAMAEVQAALVIAQSRPRDVVRARERLTAECSRTKLANVAIYAFPRGGQSISGASIRLAEAAARAWGNMTYGFRELNREDGGSEVEAFAWDLETNTKAVRQFNVKHMRDKRGGPVALNDERDIYEMVANQSQRRVRAAILEILPGDYVEDAMNECKKTLHAAVCGKNGEPLGEVVKGMIAAFEKLDVSKTAIETRIGHRVESIQPGEVLRLREIYASIQDGYSTAAEWFEVSDSQDSAKKTVEILKKAAKGKATAADIASTTPDTRPCPNRLHVDTQEPMQILATVCETCKDRPECPSWG